MSPARRSNRPLRPSRPTIGPVSSAAPLITDSSSLRLASLTLPENEADPRGMAGNAARCALELALLDAYGRRFGESVGRAVELADVEGLKRFPKPRWVRYSAAITAESAKGEAISAWKIWIYGFSQVKVKVGTAGQDDSRRLARMRRILGPRIDLRLDANEAWPAAELLDRVEPLRQFKPECTRATGAARRGRRARRAPAPFGHSRHAR